MLSKKEKKKWALIVIGAVILFMAYMNGQGRTGLNTDFNAWYAQNNQAVVFVAAGLILFMIFWGFHESKHDRQLKTIKAQSRLYEAAGRAGALQQQRK